MAEVVDRPLSLPPSPSSVREDGNEKEDDFSRGDGQYFQVIGLSEDGNVATLKDWAEGSPDGGTKTMKVECDEDKEIIRNGLKKEHHQLFCTVWLEDTMEDFKLLPKDPPILGMPELVMEKIFSSLHIHDLLDCRSVCPTWGFEYLPMQRLLSCKKLTIIKSDAFYEAHEVHADGNKKDEGYCIEVDAEHLSGMLEASVFNKLEHVELLDPDLTIFMKEDLINILKKPSKAVEFEFQKREIDVKKGCDMQAISIWTGIKNFVSNNKDHLQTVRINSKIPEDVLDLKSFLANLSTLKTLRITLRHNGSLKNLDSLPISITWLCLLKLTVPLTSTEVSWISTNLTNLVRTDLHVKHSHRNRGKDNENEITGAKITEIATTHPTLQGMSLALGDWDEDALGPDVYGFCAEVKDWQHIVARPLKEKGWTVNLRSVGRVECLNLFKLQNEQVPFKDFSDWTDYYRSDDDEDSESENESDMSFDEDEGSDNWSYDEGSDDGSYDTISDTDTEDTSDSDEDDLYQDT